MLLSARALPIGSLLLALGCVRPVSPPDTAHRDWAVAGGDAESRKFSPLDQINRSNVARLEVAWTYRTGDASAEDRSMIQCNPIVVGTVLFCTSPGLKAFAVRADTGAELWSFDPFEHQKRENHVNRGLVYWADGADRRIFLTAGPWMYALDAVTGRPITGFGRDGRVDLREGLGRDPAALQVSATSPGVIFRDLLIQGTRVPEGETGSPGHIRAYDVRTGAIRWTFRTIPAPGEYGYETWAADSWKHSGGANAWAGLSLDRERGIVYAPTGSASFDFDGSDRPGANLFANSVLALNAATGERIWHYQVVHHDIWDYDLPAPPTLVSIRRNGKRVDALAQITKTGHVFVLHRETGQPVFPVEERPMPRSELEGEQSWPTQPVPLLPQPFARQSFGEADVTDISAAARASVLTQLRQARAGALYTPLGLQEMVVVPGMNGGGEWGGAAFDPATGVLYVNGNELPYLTRMWEKDAPIGSSTGLGEATFVAQCSGCHGRERQGDGERVPSLRDVAKRLSAGQVRDVIDHGRGFMPAFARLPEIEKRAVVAYLMGQDEPQPAATGSSPARRPGESAYRFGGYKRFLDAEGYPAIKPPWGTLNAIDLNTGEYLWRVTLGEHPELTARGIPPTGATNYGGPVVTAGGLVFIAATADAKIRAFDKATGEEVWEAPLPTAGYATPSTYMVDGRQYVVVAAGGGRVGQKSGDSYVAFALPR